MNVAGPEIRQDLVLIGGGHSHAIALRLFGMNPLPGVRLVLITEASDTPYSGMLPGHIAGFYRHSDCHIDLRALSQFAGAQLYLDQVVGLDLEQRQVICAHRPPVRFDWVSIDIGSTPKPPSILGDAAAMIPAKPVRQFLAQWEQLLQQVSQTPEQPLSLGIVGGGAGGVELAVTMQHHLGQLLKTAGQPATNLTLHLFHRDRELLPKHNPWVRRRFQQILTQRGIHLHLEETVETVYPGKVVCQSGLAVACDRVFWVTQAAAPDWLAQAGLQVDEDGFVLVDDTLRSLSHPRVFAAGDIATMVNHPRPKAGVFAVRQGKPLFHNLRRALQNQPLKPFRPQRQYLSLIGTGDGSAIASRGPFGFESVWLWRWKDAIDRAFMERFSRLPVMGPSPESPGLHDPVAPKMYCAGCGSKVSSSVLERVLKRVYSDVPGASQPASILVGLEAPDDGAVLELPPDRVLVQTIDYFPAIINDPFLFGQISTNHALSDLFAMGAQAQSALAIATIPHARAEVAEEILYQLLAGAVRVLREAGAVLIGGHTTEGDNLAFGLACNGLAEPARLLRKSGLQPGQHLILTKPLGTGTLFAAQMQGQARAEWIDRAVATMLQSNQPAAECFLAHGATACTDITGFGLIGHLREMVRASGVAVTLNLAAIPLLSGAFESANLGIVSSLQPQNLQAAGEIANRAEVQSHPLFPLLFDPQTSGGLLASVPAALSDRCLSALKDLGYAQSARIGEVQPLSATLPIQIL